MRKVDTQLWVNISGKTTNRHTYKALNKNALLRDLACCYIISKNILILYLFLNYSS